MSQTRAESIGFIGLGNMGAPIARNLLRAGHRVTVYNRTAEKTAPLAEAGAAVAGTPRETVSPGSIVFSIVTDDAALEAVTNGVDGILGQIGHGGVHVSMSTIGVATARAMETRFADIGARYLCAPVFGRPPVAAAAELAMALSGDPAGKQRIKPLLGAISRRIDDFGTAPGAANVVKLAGNFMIGAAIEALAEACALAEKNGVDREAFIGLITGTLFDCPVYQGYGKAVATRQYLPAGSRMTLGLKDMSLVLAAAHAVHLAMPIGSLVRDRLMASVAKGRGEIDWAGLETLIAEEAGLPV